jgi:hypothetical protein
MVPEIGISSSSEFINSMPSTSKYYLAKKWYKMTRSSTFIFGAHVTLISSLSSSEIIVESSLAEKIFAIGTPVLAAMLTYNCRIFSKFSVGQYVVEYGYYS